MTYAQAHTKIITWLQARGWTLSDPTLKIRHITSPDGLTRFWFKTQSILSTTHGPFAHQSSRHAFGNARSAIGYSWDVRAKVSASVDDTCSELLRLNIGRGWETQTIERTNNQTKE